MSKIESNVYLIENLEELNCDYILYEVVNLSKDLYDYDSDELNPRKNLHNFTDEERLLVKRISIIVSVLLSLSSIVTFNLSNILSMFSTSRSFIYIFCPTNKVERSSSFIFNFKRGTFFPSIFFGLQLR